MIQVKYNAVIAEGIPYYLTVRHLLDQHGKCYFTSTDGSRLPYVGSVKPIFGFNMRDLIERAQQNGYTVLSAESEEELDKLIRNSKIFPPRPTNNPRAGYGKIARKYSDPDPAYIEVNYKPGDLLWFVSKAKIPVVCAPVEFVSVMWDMNHTVLHYHFQGYLDEEGKAPDEVFPTAFELYAAMTCKDEKALTAEDLIAAAKEVV